MSSPLPPTGVTAVAGNTTAAISWTAPSSFGIGTLTGYTATATPGNVTCATATTSCTISGLTDGTTYSVTVVTTTTVGNSVPSSPAVTVTPVGFLSITVPASASLPGTAPGSQSSAAFGLVTVTDNRGSAPASCTVTVTATAFTSGGQTIPAADLAYWSGPAVSTTGTGTFTPG